MAMLYKWATFFIIETETLIWALGSFFFVFVFSYVKHSFSHCSVRCAYEGRVTKQKRPRTMERETPKRCHPAGFMPIEKTVIQELTAKPCVAAGSHNFCQQAVNGIFITLDFPGIP